MLVREATGRRKTGDLSIEVEVETTETIGVFPPRVGIWEAKRDTSLRNGVEYTPTKLLAADKTKRDTITELTSCLKELPIIEVSPRTSIHVHVNVTRHTLRQVWTSVAAYWLLDNLLMKYCGQDREGNLFCLRLKESEGVIQTIIQDLNGRTPFLQFHDDNIARYSSQNVNAIFKFGSLEYRGMRGTYDPGVIDTWSSVVHGVVHRSKQFKDPADMMDTFLRVGPQAFMAKLLPESFIEVLNNFGNADNLIGENVGILAPMCYAVDWSLWEAAIDERFGTKKTAQDMPVAVPEPVNRAVGGRRLDVNRLMFDEVPR